MAQNISVSSSTCRMRSSRLNDPRNAFPTRIPAPAVLPKALEIPGGRGFADQNQTIAKKTRKTGWQCLKESDISVVADSVNFTDLGSYRFQATMLTPSGLSELLNDRDVFYHAYAVGQKMKEIDMAADIFELIVLALDRLLVELAAAFFDRVPGPHFTFIDPRNRKSSNEIINRVRSLVKQFEDGGINRNRIVVNIPSTEDGVRATHVLWNCDRINVNLTFLGHVSHAIICALAGAAYITFDVKALSTAYTIRGEVNCASETIQHTIFYFNLHNIQTKILVCGLSDLGQTADLSGLHYICLNNDQSMQAQHPVQFTGKPGPLSPSPNMPVLPTPAEYTEKLFKSDDEGGLDGKFLQYVSSAVRGIILSTHSSALIGIEVTMDNLCSLIKDDVVRYRLLTSRLATREHGMKILESVALMSLIKIIEEHKDMDKGFNLWAHTLSGVVTLHSIKVDLVHTDKDKYGRELVKIEKSDDYYMKNGYRVFTIRVPSPFVNRQPLLESNRWADETVTFSPRDEVYF